MTHILEANPESGASQARNSIFDKIEDELNSHNAQQPTEREAKPVVEGKKNSNNPNEQEHDWEKRYKDSSREIQRIHEELKKVEPYIPIVKLAERDPQFLDYIASYGDDTKTDINKTEQILKRLGVGDGFVFDAEEAVLNRDSVSGKVLGAMVDEIASGKTNESKKEIIGAVKNMFEVERFKQQNKLTDSQFDELKKFASGLKLDWQTVYGIMKSQGGGNPQITKNTIDSDNSQREKASVTPSAGNKSNQQQEQSVAEQVFSAIKNVNQKKNLFDF